MKPVRVVVCGTNYGRSYLDAIRLAGSAYKLVGILARGSARSREVARHHGVALYQNVDELPRDLEIACAAMGASGSEAVLRLLERGIHVLCEHPQKTHHLKAALQIAAAHKVRFHLNGHFADLEAAGAFIRHGRHLQQSAMPSFFDVMVTDRSLYAALDILRRVVETFEPFQFDVVSRSAPFTVIQGTLGAVRTTLQVQCSRRAGQSALKDGDPNYLIDHRIAAGFPTGVLTLMSISGPVVWNSNCNWEGHAAGRLWTAIYEDGTITMQRLHRQRIVANLRAMEALLRDAREHAMPLEQTPTYLLAVGRVWESIGGML